MGYARSTKIAADAAQFSFYQYHPEAVSWTVTGSAEPLQPAVFRFDDVTDPTAYYYDPVYWALEQGVTVGTSATSFSPEKSCTRGQIVTFLWRCAGSPEPTRTENPFEDLRSDAYYYKAVLWALEQGVTSGTGETSFSPHQSCTRAQIVTFLYQYHQ